MGLSPDRYRHIGTFDGLNKRLAGNKRTEPRSAALHDWASLIAIVAFGVVAAACLAGFVLPELPR